MRNVYPGNKLVDAYPGGFWPDLSLVFKGARDFAESATAASIIISEDPYRHNFL